MKKAYHIIYNRYLYRWIDINIIISQNLLNFSCCKEQNWQEQALTMFQKFSFSVFLPDCKDIFAFFQVFLCIAFECLNWQKVHLIYVLFSLYIYFHSSEASLAAHSSLSEKKIMKSGGCKLLKRNQFTMKVTHSYTALASLKLVQEWYTSPMDVLLL